MIIPKNKKQILEKNRSEFNQIDKNSKFSIIIGSGKFCLKKYLFKSHRTTGIMGITDHSINFVGINSNADKYLYKIAFLLDRRNKSL